MLLRKEIDTLGKQLLRHSDKWLLAALCGAMFLAILLAVMSDNLFLVAVPVGLPVLYLAIVDFRKLYLLLWFFIPLSTEMYFAGGIGTDMPSEPLMLLLCGVGLLYFLHHLPRLDFSLLKHPLSILLLLHYGWILATAMLSDSPVISFKFALAKTWYLITFYVLAAVLIENVERFTTVIKWVLVSILLTIGVITVRHAGLAFSFESINYVVGPFYRNHVSYGCLLAIFFPFVWYLRKLTDGTRNSLLIWLVAVLGILMAIQFSYTRAAYLGVAFAAGWFVVIRLKLTKILIVASLLVAALGITTLSNNNRYIDFAPDYERTITHYQFDDLLSATYKFEDISTMERFYRWIGAFYMLQESPVFGFGPGTFYTFYKSYTDRNFITYVSDNPEKSGTHNYFLMTATDQGIPGLLIFLAICFYVLMLGEKLYHRHRDVRLRAVILACTASFVTILFISLLNDMVETDKIGSFFFFIMAILVMTDLKRFKA